VQRISTGDCAGDCAGAKVQQRCRGGAGAEQVIVQWHCRAGVEMQVKVQKFRAVDCAGAEVLQRFSRGEEAKRAGGGAEVQDMEILRCKGVQCAKMEVLW
jgi:hypothetical protein